MKLTLMSVAALSLLGGVASLAQAEDIQPTSENYHYGMALEVAKVLSIHEEPGTKNQISTVKMLYLDHNDQVRSVTYLKQSTNEHNQN
ncbi:DUF2790 domain-containing protein [Pseudomonas sp. 5P_3.1_Bac2]|uniref:DUF2790 domain-containing protein n=1 Tax=Pseudomonas sp. 5P_3.1_Bac2 TaxID=2971617 RepID=UPI0021C9A258|nr:DUF2790 domain-containing protein [Pseudomonas sp. 5P_3.1_Bac2]MCU1719592.1 DUF2790 domain-containing protein [Pseudomonas sp. 5P_3.1_Bac2]